MISHDLLSHLSVPDHIHALGTAYAAAHARICRSDDRVPCFLILTSSGLVTPYTSPYGEGEQQNPGLGNEGTCQSHTWRSVSWCHHP